MDTYSVKLIGLFDNIVFRWQGKAKGLNHAIRIASAIYDGPFKRGEKA